MRIDQVRIACAGVVPRIYAGAVNAEGTEFTGEKKDVTEDALRAVSVYEDLAMPAGRRMRSEMDSALATALLRKVS